MGWTTKGLGFDFPQREEIPPSSGFYAGSAAAPPILSTPSTKNFFPRYKAASRDLAPILSSKQTRFILIYISPLLRLFNFFYHGSTALVGLGLFYEVPRSHSFRHTTLGRTPLDELSARRSDLYLTMHNTRKRQISMSLAGFEAAIPASERPQTHVLDRMATGIGRLFSTSDYSKLRLILRTFASLMDFSQ
jgi:hypothetical protein